MDSTFIKEPMCPGLGIDFIVGNYSSPGRLSSINGFDFPHEDFTSGETRGQRAVFQLMLAAEKTSEENWEGWFQTVLLGAAKALAEPGERSRRGAAVGFFYALEEMLVSLALSGAWRAALIEQMSAQRDFKVREHTQEMEDHDQFVASMLQPAQLLTDAGEAPKARAKSDKSRAKPVAA